MRTLLKMFLVCATAVVLLQVTTIAWFLFYSQDLPDTRLLAQFAPTTPVTVSDRCLKESNAIPYTSIGSNLQSALRAVAVSETDPGVLTELYQQLTGHQSPQRAALSLQLARTMFCEPSKMLNRREKEIRTAVQLERHFSRRELFTMYANRTYFGDGLIGVQAASRSLFLKEPGELTVAEAALIAGLVKSPSRYSPLQHPDRALQRRNEVVEAMLGNGTISVSQAETAKATALGLASLHVSTMPP